MVSAATSTAGVAVTSVLLEETPLQKFFQVKCLLEMDWVLSLQMSCRQFTCAAAVATQLTACGELKVQLTFRAARMPVRCGAKVQLLRPGSTGCQAEELDI